MALLTSGSADPSRLLSTSRWASYHLNFITVHVIMTGPGISTFLLVRRLTSPFPILAFVPQFLLRCLRSVRSISGVKVKDITSSIISFSTSDQGLRQCGPGWHFWSIAQGPLYPADRGLVALPTADDHWRDRGQHVEVQDASRVDSSLPNSDRGTNSLSQVLWSLYSLQYCANHR